MPIIPRYCLYQSLTHVTIEVSIPHVRVSPSSTELVIVDGTELHLHAPPTYLLKLLLPDRVVDEEAVEDSLSKCSQIQSDKNAISIEAVNATTNGAIDANNEHDRNDANNTETEHFPMQRLWTKSDLPRLQYNPEKNHGTLIVILRKEQDRYWQDLDLLGRLQQPVQRKSEKKNGSNGGNGKVLVQVIGENDDKDLASSVLEDCISEDITDESGAGTSSANDTMEGLMSVNHKKPTYGLFQQYSNVFRDYAREGLAHEMLECPNPDEIYKRDDALISDSSDTEDPEKARRKMRLDMENEKFDSDRYLADLNIAIEGDMIYDSAMMMVPHWMENELMQNPNESNIKITTNLAEMSISDHHSTTTIHEAHQFFTQDESHLLATLPPQRNRPTNLTPEQSRSAFLSLFDILFAYAYDHRTTAGDPTVESSWTIMILSPSLSWLENYTPPYDTIVDVVRWCFRRSLIYPYIRSYILAQQLLEDVCQIFLKGRRCAIRCLLQLHNIIEKSEAHYLFNKLYVDPLIDWCQKCEETDFQNFGKEVRDMFMDSENGKSTKNGNCVHSSALVSKESLDLKLIELEHSLFSSDDEEESTSSSSRENDSSESDYEDDSSDGSRTNKDEDEDEGELSEQTNHAGIEEKQGKLVELMESLDFEPTKKRLIEEP